MQFIYISLLKVYNTIMPKSDTLAIFGGTPVINFLFEKFLTIDQTDVAEANRVVKSGLLSQFVGDTGDYFLGGPEVRTFEEQFAKKFETSFAVSVNSWTSGLWIAIGGL